MGRGGLALDNESERTLSQLAQDELMKLLDELQTFFSSGSRAGSVVSASELKFTNVKFLRGAKIYLQLLKKAKITDTVDWFSSSEVEDSLQHISKDLDGILLKEDLLRLLQGTA